jgi:HSP20 family molecular chaperone IbpA
MCYPIVTRYERKRIYMMLVPRRNSFDLFDDFFEDNFFKTKESNLMRTDIKEKKNKYLIDVDLPGFEKENIKLSLDSGYLTIHAKTHNEKNDSHDEKILRKERFYGECSRSFYVGEDIKEEEINAEFKNGILMIEIPKKELENKHPERKQIEIK